MDHEKDLELFHATGTYDPAKAREYYLRTRELKGRTAVQPSSSTGKTGSSVTVKGLTPKVVVPKLTSTQRNAQAKEKVIALKAKLEKLKDLLKKLVEQAQKRSGVKDNSKEKSVTKTATAKPGTKASSSDLTAAQKKEKADKAAKEAAKNPTVKEETADLEKKIAEVMKKITKAKADLKASADKERVQATSTNKGRSTSK